MLLSSTITRALFSLLVYTSVCVPAVSRGAKAFLAQPSQTKAYPLSSSSSSSSSPSAFVRGGSSTVAPKSTFASTATSTSKLAAATTAETEIPSWEDLESKLEGIQSQMEEKKPVLTLYRDTNGWCPFCERVWVAVRAKGLPYQETLVPLQGKPEWYKQMVPTGLVPAVLFHGEEDDSDSDDAKIKTSRELVWESDAILKALDERFPDTIPLMSPNSNDSDSEDFDTALELQNRLQVAGLKMAYGNRNGNQTEAEREQHRSDFGTALDELDEALSRQEGGFRLGADFSGIDAVMVPTLERWRYQLPLTHDFDILEDRPHIRAWFETMESYPAYYERVAGDEYSWTAVASTFLRYFGGGEDKPEVAAGIARADAAAEQLAAGFAEGMSSSSSSRFDGDSTAWALEAASKLVSNHAAVLTDCLREVEPKSQGHIPRAEASARDTVDALLRHVADRLIQLASEEDKESSTTTSSSASALAVSSLLTETEASHAAQGALALRTVAKRLCVPRDMGAPSAALLRGVLATVADDLSSVVEAEAEETELAMEA
mmetsp:Transcript_13709/g.38585  ORF Transcript_13709/g.38585 Transcript_13709/m.38585 type:complete len:546 (-) Transcript_13709:293-1930(-)